MLKAWADSKNLSGVCVNKYSFLFCQYASSSNSCVWQLGLILHWAKYMLQLFHVRKLLCFPGNFLYRIYHKIEVHLGCPKGHLRGPLEALKSFLQLQFNHVEWSGALHQREAVKYLNSYSEGSWLNSVSRARDS